MHIHTYTYTHTHLRPLSILLLLHGADWSSKPPDVPPGLLLPKWPPPATAAACGRVCIVCIRSVGMYVHTSCLGMCVCLCGCVVCMRGVGMNMHTSCEGMCVCVCASVLCVSEVLGRTHKRFLHSRPPTFPLGQCVCKRKAYV